MKYTHRISVPAWITFDLHSDNDDVKAAEVDAAIGHLIEPTEFPEIAEGAVVNIQSEAFTDDRLKVFYVEDTITKKRQPYE